MISDRGDVFRVSHILKLTRRGNRKRSPDPLRPFPSGARASVISSASTSITTCGSTHTLGSMLLSTRAGFLSLTYGSQRSFTSRHWASLKPVDLGYGREDVALRVVGGNECAHAEHGPPSPAVDVADDDPVNGILEVARLCALELDPVVVAPQPGMVSRASWRPSLQPCWMESLNTSSSSSGSLLVWASEMRMVSLLPPHVRGWRASRCRIAPALSPSA